MITLVVAMSDMWKPSLLPPMLPSARLCTLLQTVTRLSWNTCNMVSHKEYVESPGSMVIWSVTRL